MATVRNRRARLIPLVQRLSFGTRSASEWTVAACTEDAEPLAKTMPRTDPFSNSSSWERSALTLHFCKRYLNLRRT